MRQLPSLLALHTGTMDLARRINNVALRAAAGIAP
jgi:hypothetical protein